MASIGSSLVNKSGRKIAPRAAVRRKPQLFTAVQPSPPHQAHAQAQVSSSSSITPLQRESSSPQPAIELDSSTHNTRPVQPPSERVLEDFPTGSTGHDGTPDWIVTTPDQIRKSGQEQPDKLLRNTSKSSVSLTQSNLISLSTSSADPPETITKSARLQNAQRRKSRRQKTSGREPGSSTDNTASGGKKWKRLDSPEESEAIAIVPSMVTMFELASRNRRTGLKSEREKRMAAIDWVQVKRRRQEDERRLAEAGRRRLKTNDAADDDNEPDQNSDSAQRASQRVQLRIVNGQHVFENLRVDRHAIANLDVDTLEEFEAHNETDHFNSHTYVRLKRREVAERLSNFDRWTSEATDQFYDCLSRFGTDFMIIAHMFPTRTRRQIKAKFTREERLNPDRVRLALTNYDPDRPRWNLGVFQKNSGWDAFKDPRELDQELRVLRDAEEKNIELKKQEYEEIRKQRRLAGDISDEDDDPDATGAVGPDTASKHIPFKAVHMADDAEVLDIVSESDD